MNWIKEHKGLSLGIGLLLLAIIGFIIYWATNKGQTPPAAIISTEGNPCTATSGKPGKIINKVCVENPPKEGDTCTTTNGKTGKIVNGTCTPPPLTNLTPGQKAYIDTSYPSDVMIYSYPQATSQGTYLLGSHHKDWSGVNPIGDFVEIAGNTGFAKITVKDLQIYKWPGYTVLDKVTGDVFVDVAAVKNSPY